MGLRWGWGEEGEVEFVGSGLIYLCLHFITVGCAR